MSYNQFSRPYTPREYTSPVDLDVYGKGKLLQEGRMKEDFNAIQNTINSVMGINAIAPQDQEILTQRQQEFQQSLQGIDVSDLSNPRTVSKINSVISQFTNDPDILGIATRSSQINKELQTKKDYEAKGKTYVSPLLRQAEDYIKGGNYYRDTRFNKSGFVAADDNDYNEIAKNTPEWEKWTTSGRYDIHQKGKTEESLAFNAYNTFKTNPKFYNKLNDQFEQNLENVNIEDIHNQGIEGVKQLFPHLPLEAQQAALAKIEEGYQLQQNNPYIGNAWKDKLKDDFFKDQALMYAKAKTYVNTVGMEANEFVKIAIQNAEKRELQKATNELRLKEIDARIEATKDKLELQKEMLQQKLEFQKQSQDAKLQADAAKTELQLKKLEAQIALKKNTPTAKTEVVREDVNSFRELYNKDKSKVEKILKQKAGSLGYLFDEDDIEDVKWNKDTNRYEVKIDKAGMDKPISFTQEEIDELKGINSTEPTEDPLNLFK